MFQKKALFSIFIIFACFLISPVFAQSPDVFSKVDPLLQIEAKKLLNRWQPVQVKTTQIEGQAAQLDREALSRLRATMKIPEKVAARPQGLSTQVRQGQVFLDTFIVLAPGASTRNLEKLGVIIGSRAEDIITADIPPEVLEKVNALKEVVYIRGSRYGAPMNDQATTETGVQQVWSTMGYRGSGTIVGVMDSGIDWTHEDFKYPSGNTRILQIWDHTDNGGPNPFGFDYGSVWTSSDLNAGSAREQDNDEASGGHGTHVTGTAAGDGSATGNGQPAGRFTGVANEAEIVFVKTDWTEQSWADGVSWMFQVADANQKPISINLSLGTIDGPHDGSTPLEQYYDSLLGGPGKCITIAAANSGGQTIHAFSTLDSNTGSGGSIDDTPVVAFWAYPIQGMQIPLAEVEFYYPAGQSIQWRPIWTDFFGNFQTTDNWYGDNSTQETFNSNEGYDFTFVVQKPFNDGRNVLNYSYLKVESQTIQLNGTIFYIQLDGPGVPVHFWHINRDMGSLAGQQVFTNSGIAAPSKLIEPDDSYVLGNPGTTSEAITVASYVTKVQWTDVNGQSQTQQGASIGETSSFSSKGPRRDGQSSIAQQKPDVSAPGEVLVSALSSVLQQRPAAEIERDGVHQKMQGTSMSSPLVAGLIALMFEKNPSLSADQIKTILRDTAREAGDTGWDKVFGAGKVDAVAALNAVPTGQVDTPTPTATATATGQPTSTPTATPPPGGSAGDVNLDQVVDTRDAIRLLRHIEGIETLSGQGLTNADADGSGQVNTSDVDWILDRAVGK
jgi:subtilisin family serine protease